MAYLLVICRNSISKVYPAMYIENVTELAFDDITPEDPDFSSIQGVNFRFLGYSINESVIGFVCLLEFICILSGLAEAGLISSRLSRNDMLSSLDEDESPFYFSPERWCNRFLEI